MTSAPIDGSPSTGAWRILPGLFLFVAATTGVLHLVVDHPGVAEFLAAGSWGLVFASIAAGARAFVVRPSSPSAPTVAQGAGGHWKPLGGIGLGTALGLSAIAGIRVGFPTEPKIYAMVGTTVLAIAVVRFVRRPVRVDSWIIGAMAFAGLSGLYLRESPFMAQVAAVLGVAAVVLAWRSARLTGGLEAF